MTGDDALADRLAQALARAGADRAFGVPGGGANLSLIEAMERQGIRFVLAHGETAACIMASTYGHLTGRPAATVVTRGPGAASAVNGAAQATLDRHPLVLVTDTVPAASAARVAHQRIDQRALLAPVTRASGTIGVDADDATLDELIARSLTPPAGAVHLDVDPDGPTAVPAADPPLDRATAEPISAASAVVSGADHPLVIVGLGGTADPDHLRRTLERFGAPVLTTYQGAGAVPADHPLAAGLFTNGASEQPILDLADVVITIGLDPVEPIPAPWDRTVPIVSLATHPTTDPYLPIEHELVGQPAELAERVLWGTHRWAPDAGAVHRRTVLAALGDEEGSRGDPGDVDRAGELTPIGLVARLAAGGPPHPVTTVDAGAHFLAVMPFWPVRRPGELLISNGLATMGYAVPAAIGAALADPDRPVLCLVGDGGLGMTLAELETMVRLSLRITVVVFNDSALSLIRIKQRDGGSGGDAAVTYRHIDFATVARSFGMTATTATGSGDLDRALAGPDEGPRLIDARIDPRSYPHLLRVTRG
jgi:acetolactate synthase-1/2/3 large subunit